MLKTRFLLSALLFGLAVHVQAQCVVHVKVLEYNGKEAKTPISHVELQVMGASSTISNARGECVLKFRMGKPGEKIKVSRINKKGYEVFNTSAIDNWHISENAPFTIVLCKTSILEEIYDKYMKAATEHHEQKLEEDESHLVALQSQGTITTEEFERRIKQLYNEYERKLSNIENYIKHFAHLDLNNLTQQEQEILALIQDGSYNLAIAQYEKMNLIGLYKEKVETIQNLSMVDHKLSDKITDACNGRDSITNSVYNQATLLEMIGGEENYDKAGALLKNLAESDTTNFKTAHTYATFAETQNNLKDAEHYYRIALHNCPESNTEIKFKIHKNIGSYYLRRREYETSYQHLQQASLYYDKLRGNDTEANLNSFAEMKIYQGIVLRGMGKLPEAEEAYLRGLDRIEPYYVMDTAAYYDNKSMLHINLGNVYYNMNQMEQAQVQYQLAVQTLQSSNSDDFRHLRTMAGAQINIASLQLKEQRNEEALAMLDKADLTVKKAAMINPDAMVGYKENSTLTRVEALMNKGMNEEARTLLTQTMKEMQVTAQEYPHVLDSLIQLAERLAAKLDETSQYNHY